MRPAGWMPTDPKFAHQRTYLAELEGIPDPEALDDLRSGPVVKGRKSRTAEVVLLSAEPDVPPRSVPIRVRKSIPTSWILLTLFEGRNRQVRRMTAAVGHPTLRLIRTALGPLSLEGLAQGEHRPLSERERSLLFESLGLSQERSPTMRGRK